MEEDQTQPEPLLTDQEHDLRRVVEARGGDPFVIEHYELRRLIGVGGFGRVYEAHDSVHDSLVAVKILRHSADAAAREQFRTESQVAAQVSHPNLCPIYATGELDDGRPYLVMELFHRTLRDVLRREEVPNVPRVLRIVRDVARGLDALHSVGLIHRDVTPANVLLSRTGERVALTDFGLAVRHDYTGRIATAGTILFMSPEQWNAEGNLTPKSDVYNLGAVLYRGLSGRHPFEGPPEAIRANVLGERPTTPREFRFDLDPRLDPLVLRPLEKNPADRPTAREFADEIDAYLTSLVHRQQPRSSRLALQLSATAPDGTDPNRLQRDLLELCKALNDYHLALGGSGLTPVPPRPGAGVRCTSICRSSRQTAPPTTR